MSEANDVLNDPQVQELIAWVKDTAQGTSDLIAEQAPLVVQEIIWWGYVSNITTFIISFLFLAIVGGYCAKSLAAWVPESLTTDDLDREGELLFKIMFVTPPSVASLVVLIPFFKSGYSLLYIWASPRLYVIEYLQGMI